MISSINTRYARCIQPLDTSFHTKLEGKMVLPAKEDNAVYGGDLKKALDRSLKIDAEIAEQYKNMPDPPEVVQIGWSREETIGIEMGIAETKQLKASLKKADELGLSGGKRLKFLEDECMKWVENIKNNDPQMFAHYVRTYREHIESGRPELAGLPKNFTMADYYRYVKKPFSVLA